MASRARNRRRVTGTVLWKRFAEEAPKMLRTFVIFFAIGVTLAVPIQNTPGASSSVEPTRLAAVSVDRKAGQEATASEGPVANDSEADRNKRHLGGFGGIGIGVGLIGGGGFGGGIDPFYGGYGGPYGGYGGHYGGHYGGYGGHYGDYFGGPFGGGFGGGPYGGGFGGPYGGYANGYQYGYGSGYSSGFFG
ncbi:keratin, type I cytoskeletal 9-like [Anopheles nili]|uniref:keratin, type I cytoskeletal 9-like n=1 Tax=Anopheles nili TaxID=185578 RepID=UPI00237BE9C0|nr:keratin, type I cytoskeletal 9-like [Anopheles nili]